MQSGSESLTLPALEAALLHSLHSKVHSPKYNRQERIAFQEIGHQLENGWRIPEISRYLGAKAYILDGLIRELPQPESDG